MAGGSNALSACVQRAAGKMVVDQIDMSALCQSVDACIGSSGTVDADRLAADTLKRPLDMILNRVAMGLTLPSRKSFPVVGDNHF